MNISTRGMSSSLTVVRQQHRLLNNIKEKKIMVNADQGNAKFLVSLQPLLRDNGMKFNLNS